MTQPQCPRELFDECVARASAAPSGDDRATAANKALVQRYFDMWNTGDGAVADAVLGPTYLDHAHPEVIGPAAVRCLVPRFRVANPEARMTIVIAGADVARVAVRNTISGMRNRVPCESEGIAVFRVADGKLVEQWSQYPQAEAERAPRSVQPTIDAWLSFRA
jgi:predicted SnoaL-like aldol condensation-catalyzing enzyme